MSFVFASLRSNLSFDCLPALENRDRHVPRDDTILLSLRACEAISLLTVCQPRSTEIATFLAIVFLVISSAARQSLISGYLRDKGEIASSLAMTESFIAMTKISSAEQSLLALHSFALSAAKTG